MGRESNINVRVSQSTNQALKALVESGFAGTKADAIKRLLVLKKLVDKTRDEHGYYTLWLGDIPVSFKV